MRLYINRSRPKQLIIRLSESELQKIKRQVAKSGLSQQDYARLTLLTGSVTNTDGVKQVIPELKRIGNNINQITRRCNSGYPPDSGDLTYIRKELDLLWQLLKLYLPMRE